MISGRRLRLVRRGLINWLIAMSEDAGATTSSSPRSSPWLFFVAVFAWSWSFWIAVAGLGISVQSTAGVVLELIGLAGPMFGGIVFTYLTQDRAGRRDYWARMIDPRRIPPRWYAVIFLFAPALWAVAVLLERASGGGLMLAQIARTLTPYVASPAAIIPLVFGTLVYGPIPEEPGWRGYVLDRLQERRSALAASLILGAVWALYHLPLFYMKDSFHAGQGAWSAWFWLFAAQVVASAVVFTWIFNNTRRSTLGAILFHFMLNLTAELVNLTWWTNFYSTLLWIAAAGAITLHSGARTLTRGQGGPRPVP